MTTSFTYKWHYGISIYTRLCTKFTFHILSESFWFIWNSWIRPLHVPVNQEHFCTLAWKWNPCAELKHLLTFQKLSLITKIYIKSVFRVRTWRVWDCVSTVEKKSESKHRKKNLHIKIGEKKRCTFLKKLINSFQNIWLAC